MTDEDVEDDTLVDGPHGHNRSLFDLDDNKTAEEVAVEDVGDSG